MTYSTTIERDDTNYTIEWERRTDGWYIQVPTPLHDAFPHYDFGADNYTTTAFATLECFPKDVEDLVHNELN